MDEELAEDGGDVDVIFGGGFDVAVSPINASRALRHLAGYGSAPLPGQVSLVAHHDDRGQLVFFDVQDLVPELLDFGEGRVVPQAVHQDEGVPGADGQFAHGGEVVRPCRVEYIQLKRYAVDVVTSLMELLHRRFVLALELFVQEAVDDTRLPHAGGSHDNHPEVAGGYPQPWIAGVGVLAIGSHHLPPSAQMKSGYSTQQVVQLESSQYDAI